MSFIVIIPARYSSSRLPGKPLVDIGGKPMIQRVYELAEKSKADEVYIATDNDDERIEFVTTVLQDVHRFQNEHNNVIGYLYWSLLDNFEWDLGYQMNFGLVDVNRETYERIPHKSASWFGNISSSNVLSIK